MADEETFTDTPGQDGSGETFTNTNDAPVTAGGVGAQFLRGAESAPYQMLTAGIDVPVNAWNAV